MRDKAYSSRITHQFFDEIIQLVGGKTIPAIKAGVACFGRSTAHMKIPGQTLDEAEIERVKDILVKLGVL